MTTPGRSDGREMPQEWADRIDELYRDFGPLSEDQRSRLRTLLAPSVQSGGEASDAA